MKVFLQRFACALAFAGALMVGGVSATTPAGAADLPVVTVPPGTLYELGSFQRRGVLIVDGGTLEIRADGCWRTDMTITNTNPVPRTVSVSFRWYSAAGRLLVDLPVVANQTIAAGGSFPVATNGCSPQVARYYAPLSQISVVRFMSVR